MLFHCDYFLFYSNTIFIDVFKCNTYKKHIMQRFLILHLGYLDLYIKLLKQVATHLEGALGCVSFPKSYGRKFRRYQLSSMELTTIVN